MLYILEFAVFFFNLVSFVNLRTNVFNRVKIKLRERKKETTNLLGQQLQQSQRRLKAKKPYLILPIGKLIPLSTKPSRLQQYIMSI